MKDRERSAGVVLYRGDPRRYLLLHYPSGHWDFPKGHVEAGETDVQAALREVQEETGIRDVTIHPGFEHSYDYYYRRDARRIHKTVVYFIGRTDEESVQVSVEHRGFVWLPFEKARSRVTYDNARDLLTKAEGHLASARTSQTGTA